MPLEGEQNKISQSCLEDILNSENFILWVLKEGSWLMSAATILLYPQPFILCCKPRAPGQL